MHTCPVQTGTAQEKQSLDTEIPKVSDSVMQTADAVQQKIYLAFMVIYVLL